MKLEKVSDRRTLSEAEATTGTKIKVVCSLCSNRVLLCESYAIIDGAPFTYVCETCHEANDKK